MPVSEEQERWFTDRFATDRPAIPGKSEPVNSDGEGWFKQRFVNKAPNLLPAVDAGSKIDPEHLKLSEQTGMSLNYVRDHADELRRQDHIRSMDLDNLPKTHPKTAEFLSDPHNAAVGTNDLTILKGLEDAGAEAAQSWYKFRPDKFLENISKTMPESFRIGAFGTATALSDVSRQERVEDIVPMGALPMGMEMEALDMSRQVASNVGIQTDEELVEAHKEHIDSLVDQIKQGEQKISELTPDDLSILEAGARSGIDSLVRQLPGLAASLATGKPIFALAPMVGQVSAEAYGKGRAEGLSPLQSGVFATTEGAIEYVTEKIPADTLIDIFKSIGKEGTVRKLTKFAISEIGGEQAATFGQSINAYAHGLNEELERAETFEEKLEIQGRQQAITFFASLVGSGIQSGVATGAGAAINALQKRSTDVMEESLQSLSDQQIIDQVVNYSQSSTLNQDAPTKYEEFLKNAVDDKQVFIPTEIARQIPNAPDYITSQFNLSDADVTIPMEKFASEIAPNEELMGVIRPHLSLRPTGMSLNDMETGEFTDIQGLMEKAQAAQDIVTESDRIYDQVRDQIVGTGRQSDQTARLSAKIIPAYVSSYVERAREAGHDISPREVYEKMGLSIVGPATRAPIPDVGGQVILDQGESVLSQEFGDTNISEQRIIEETGETVTITRKAQEVWDETIDRRSKIKALVDCINA